jgi:hypothetical protein
VRVRSAPGANLLSPCASASGNEMTYLFQIGIAPGYTYTNRVKLTALGHFISGFQVSVDGGGGSRQIPRLEDRVRAGIMSPDDVVIVQGLYRPGIVSQRGVAGIIVVDQVALMGKMRRVGAHWARSTRERSAQNHGRTGDTLSEGETRDYSPPRRGLSSAQSCSYGPPPTGHGTIAAKLRAAERLSGVDADCDVAVHLRLRSCTATVP